MKDFGKFIGKISVRESKDLKLFFNYLKKLHPNFTSVNIEKKFVAQKVFPNDSNNVKKVLNLIYKVSNLFEEFLVNEELKNNETEKNFLLLEALKKRKLNKYFFRKINQIKDDWNKDKPNGVEHLHHLYRLNQTSFTHPDYSLIKDMPINHSSLMSDIDRYYFAVKLYWTLCNFNTNNYVINTENDLKTNEYLIEEIIELSTEDTFAQTPQIALFSKLLAAFKQNDFSNYSDIKLDFVSNHQLFKNFEKNDLLAFLTTACYENYKLGIPNALSELFELNCFAIENNFVFHDGYIPNEHFRNIVFIACAASELEWTEKFIQDYGHYLPENDRKDTLIITNASLAFYKSEFEVALQLLATVKFQNLFYGLHANSIKLQCYYELDGYDELFLNLAKSFYMFLNRKDAFSDSIKESFSNFIFFSKKLKKAQFSKGKNLNDLFEQINNTQNIAHKSWINSKVEEFKSKNE